MSPAVPKSGPEKIIEAFYSSLDKETAISPQFLNINKSGVINFMSDPIKDLIKNNHFNFDPGYSCLNFFPAPVIPDFKLKLSSVVLHKIPETFLYSYKENNYKINLTPIFSNSGNIDQVQLIFSVERKDNETQTQRNFPEAIPVNKNLLKVYPSQSLNDSGKLNEEIRIAHERFKLVSKAIREAVYDWDMETNSIEWSDSYYELYGYEKKSESLSLSQWEQQIHPEDRELVLKKLQAAIKGGDTKWDCEYRLLDVKRKIAIIHEQGYIIRDENGVAKRMIGALQDITTLKQNERALEELNFQLKKHSDELSQSNSELEQFAYIASHDLQEPLRMVTSFLTLIEKRLGGELDDKTSQYIHFARDGAVRMRQIILDLLEYSKIGKLRYDLEIVDVNLIIRDIQVFNENLIKEKNALIIYKDLPFIKAAFTPLQRVLSNLITNSIKYSRENVAPVVRISVRDRITHWEFIVEDNGIGIDDRFKDKVFEIFQRLHSRDEYSGTGIGLAICKKIVENHGGKIWINSVQGMGSAFHFTIQKHF